MRRNPWLFLNMIRSLIQHFCLSCCCCCFFSFLPNQHPDSEQNVPFRRKKIYTGAGGVRDGIAPTAIVERAQVPADSTVNTSRETGTSEIARVVGDLDSDDDVIRERNLPDVDGNAEPLSVTTSETVIFEAAESPEPVFIESSVFIPLRVPEIEFDESVPVSPPLIASRSLVDSERAAGAFRVDTPASTLRRRIQMNLDELLHDTRNTHLRMIRGNPWSRKEMILSAKDFLDEELNDFSERLSTCPRDHLKFFQLMADLIYKEELNAHWDQIPFPINLEGMQAVIFEVEKPAEQEEVLLQLCFEYVLFGRTLRSDQRRRLQRRAKAFVATRYDAPKLVRLAAGLSGLSIQQAQLISK
jgi:hypothetical protein